jgi:hypothetical protein
MTLSDALQAACAAMISTGASPDSFYMSTATHESRHDDLVVCMGDPPWMYYYNGTIPIEVEIDESVPDGVIRIGGYGPRVAADVEE